MTPAHDTGLLLLGLLGLLAGAALGALYFLWLWWTLLAMVDRRRAGVWFAVNIVLRLAFALAGFALLARWGGWPSTVAGLLGFIAARTLLTRRLQPPPRHGGTSP
jgi:F1F0 ATPase subunit 2